MFLDYSKLWNALAATFAFPNDSDSFNIRILEQMEGQPKHFYLVLADNTHVSGGFLVYSHASHADLGNGNVAPSASQHITLIDTEISQQALNG